MTREQFIASVSAEQESLRRFLCALCGGDRFMADDIAQEALLKAYLSFTRFEGRSRFGTWLFRIACNCFYDRKKQGASLRGGTFADLPASEGFSDEESDAGFRYQKLYAAVDELPENEKVAVLLFYMEDKSVKEISDITGMPQVTVRSHLFRARKHLKKFLSDDSI